MFGQNNTSSLSRVATVILHYGDPALARRLEEQLHTTDPSEAEHIFVLDNHAPEQYPHAWQRTEQNLYWAGALQYTLEAMEEKGYTHVWFMNNDVYFITPAPVIARARARLHRLDTTIGPVGIYTPAVTVNPYHPQMVQNEKAQYRTVRYADGIAPLITLQCWRELGGVDYADNAYGYGVDTWLSLSADRAGWHVVVDHQVAVRHTYHSTAKKVTGFLERAAHAEHAYFTKRLGAGYRDYLDRLKHTFHDEDRL